jgi:hypothetical protein
MMEERKIGLLGQRSATPQDVNKMDWHRKFPSSLYALLIIAIVVGALTPDVFLNVSFVKIILGKVAQLLPKLNGDREIIAQFVGENWAGRYIFCYILSTILFVPFLFLRAIHPELGGVAQLLRLDNIRLFARFLSVLFFLYVLLFDTSLASSESRIGNAVFHTPLFIVWVPSLFSAVVNMIQITTQHLKQTR